MKKCSGYIYVASNPSMPGLLKIGKTNRSIDQRLRGLFRTGVPTGFLLEALLPVADMVRCETAIFNKLRSHRNASDREFFRVSRHEALRIVIQVCLSSLPRNVGANPQAEPELNEKLDGDEEAILGELAYEHPSGLSEVELMDLFQDKTRLTFLVGALVEKKFIKKCGRGRQQVFRLDYLGAEYVLKAGGSGRQLPSKRQLRERACALATARLAARINSKDLAEF